jgi:formamidopyrimidine-DNA glycosylase
MPELPDISIYLEALTPRVRGSVLREIRLYNPFLLRTTDPPLEAANDKRVLSLRRMGKRIVFALEDELFLVLHLMIAGRLKWTPLIHGDLAPTAAESEAKNGLVAPFAPKRPAGKLGQASFEFSTGSLLLTEAGTKRRASLHLVRGEDALGALDPGGLEVLEASLPVFLSVLQKRNHTLKRALTDPRLFSGIGNAYSDEILFRARLSPFRQTQQLPEEETERLYNACRSVLTDWIERLRAENAGGFPAKVTAFRPEMAVHGRYRQPCPDCGAPVQRIVYAENEANYCARCQTGGRLLADRSLSRLLKSDWPKTIEELEQARSSGPGCDPARLS